MKTIAVSTRNALLSDAIAMSLRRNTDLRMERVLPERCADIPRIVSACQAEVLLMEVGMIPPFAMPQRLAAAAAVRSGTPHCRIVLLCDEQSDPDLAELVKSAKRMGKIDEFVYASVSAEYLTALLDTV
jgi:hypothetical protein